MSVAVLYGGPADGFELRVPDTPPAVLALPERQVNYDNPNPGIFYYWLGDQDATGRWHYRWPREPV